MLVKPPKAFLLGLQPRFVPFVKDGSKAHTIRGERKDGKRPQPGDMITIYTGLRTKACEFVLRAPCLRTEDVLITENHTTCEGEVWMPKAIWVAGEQLNHVDADALAWRDGFRHPENPDLRRGCFEIMTRFWDGRLPFQGWITYWDFRRAEFERVPVKPRSVRAASRRFELMIHEGEQQEYGLKASGL